MFTIATNGAKNPLVFNVLSKLILMISTTVVWMSRRNGKPVKFRTQKKYRPRLKIDIRYELWSGIALDYTLDWSKYCDLIMIRTLVFSQQFGMSVKQKWRTYCWFQVLPFLVYDSKQLHRTPDSKWRRTTFLNFFQSHLHPLQRTTRRTGLHCRSCQRFEETRAWPGDWSLMIEAIIEE